MRDRRQKTDRFADRGQRAEVLGELLHDIGKEGTNAKNYSF